MEESGCIVVSKPPLSVEDYASSSSSSEEEESSLQCLAMPTSVFYPPSKSKWGHIEGCPRLNKEEHSQELPLDQAWEQGLKLCSKCPAPPPQPKRNKSNKNDSNKDSDKRNKEKNKKKGPGVPILYVYYQQGKNKGHLHGCPRLDPNDEKEDSSLTKVCYAQSIYMGLELCSKCPSPHEKEDDNFPLSWCNPPPDRMEQQTFQPSPLAPLVRWGDDGKLVYQPYTKQGDKILDWSHCGYKSSQEPLPMLPVVETLVPPTNRDELIPPNLAHQKGTDSRKIIQQVLDRVGEHKRGGAVVLEAGTWYLHGGLVIPSGVVLRGTAGKTKLICTPPCEGKTTIDNDCVLLVKGGGNIRHFDKESQVAIADDYVPSGSTKVTVTDGTNFSKGDWICVLKTTNDNWIETIGCGERLRHIRGGKEGSFKRPWQAKGYQFQHICQIVDVQANVLLLDCCLPQSIEALHGGGRVHKVKMKNLGSECGVEGLDIISNYDTTVTDQKKTADYRNFRCGIQVTNCRDGWVRDCTVRNVSYAAVLVGKHTRNITVRDCKCLHPVGPKRGGEQYAFCIDGGSLHLFFKCYSEDGRHDFVGGARTVGPFAFVRCTSVRGEQSEPHHRWGCGFLYDQITTEDGTVAALNRGDSGSGHGWAAANTMIWNASAKGVVVFKPETNGENNFAIGFRGPVHPQYDAHAVEYANTRAGYWGTRFEGGYYGYALMGNGHIESPDKQVKPDSLFVQQLIDRIGKKKANEVLA